MAVGDQLLHDLPVHKRLAAEEIHLKVLPVAGIFHQKIQRLLSDLKAHQSAAAVILALLRKAVAAGQVAVVSDVKA